MSSDDRLREKAEKIAEEKVGFYVHLSSYIMVNLFLAAIWYFTSGPSTFPWFIFPLFGWGIGIVAHGVSAFAGGSFQEKLAEKEYKKLNKK
jgi:hypothetical protein